MKLSLIFPAYNERKRILSTVKEAISYFEMRNISFEIIVSADGTDGTREIVANLNDPRVRAMGGETRGGKGLGIRRAVSLAEGEFIGFSDADNKTPITELDKVLPLLESGVPMVIGSRALKDSRVESKPLYRQIGSWGFRYCMQWITGLDGVPDTQCGFKFFRAATAKHLFSLQKTDGYMFDVEILLLAKKLKIPFEQVPVRWRDDGDSRLNIFQGNVKNLLDLVKIRTSIERR